MTRKEIRMSDYIKREDAIHILACEMYAEAQSEGYDAESVEDYIPEATAWMSDAPSAEVVLQTPQTYGKSINPTTEIMSDLISRQDAITIPVMPKEYRQYQTMNIDDAYELGWHDLQDCIEELPSADRPTGEWKSEELANMICDGICYYKEVTVDADSLDDLCEGCLIKKLIDGRSTGRWVDNTNGTYTCDRCGCKHSRSNFCPNCGADMRGESHE